MPTLTLRLPLEVLARLRDVAELSKKKPETVAAVLLAAEVVRTAPSRDKPAAKTTRRSTK